MGKSRRAMLEALIAGETDPAKLARLAGPRLKASPAQLREALRGRVTKNHRFLLRLHLKHIDALDAAIRTIDQQVEADITPFRAAVKQLITAPGVKALNAQVILSEIGLDMSHPPTSITEPRSARRTWGSRSALDSAQR
jgi:transposase